MPQYRYSLSEATEAKLQELAKANEFPVSVMLNHIIREWYKAHMSPVEQTDVTPSKALEQISPTAFFGEKRK